MSKTIEEETAEALAKDCPVCHIKAGEWCGNTEGVRNMHLKRVWDDWDLVAPTVKQDITDASYVHQHWCIIHATCNCKPLNSIERK